MTPCYIYMYVSGYFIAKKDLVLDIIDSPFVEKWWYIPTQQALDKIMCSYMGYVYVNDKEKWW